MIVIPVSAYENSNVSDHANVDWQEQVKQEQIDEIFSQMNALALEKYKISKSVMGENVKNEVAERITAQEVILDQELIGLGIQKLNANNPKDVADLMAMLSSSQGETVSMRADEIGNYVNQLLNFFTVYRYDGTRTVNGANYTYAYIRVVDNKGSNLYTKSMGNVNMLNYTPTVVSDLLRYNFDYIVDSVAGNVADMFKFGWLVDWTIGNISTVYHQIGGFSLYCMDSRVFRYEPLYFHAPLEVLYS